MTPTIRPKPTTWILRFKHHRTTVLLHVDPLQSLAAIRAELLKAVTQTNPSGRLNGHTIPQDANEVLLARPSDSQDLSLGWESLEVHEVEGASREDGKGKGKAVVGSSTGAKRGSKDKLVDCPQAVGLQDGGVVAFKFRSEFTAAARDEDEGIEVDEEYGGLDGETLVGEGAGTPEKWDVVVPTMEETYGDGPPRLPGNEVAEG
ncbi:hypothetical protein LTR15_005986 [Elasticomyces elasticus]|nr:hypothetical protein LTR15_005986 [Elasticomyces elasticus]